MKDEILKNHERLAEDERRFLAFHGGVDRIGAEGFRLDLARCDGGHANCSLAVHVTTDPETAIEYADLRARQSGRPGLVHILEVTISGRAAWCADRDGYIEMGAEDLVRARAQIPDLSLLVADELGEDLIDAAMVFDPGDIRILGCVDRRSFPALRLPAPWRRLGISGHFEADEAEPEVFVA